jgi:hypothetical protein
MVGPIFFEIVGFKVLAKFKFSRINIKIPYSNRIRLYTFGDVRAWHSVAEFGAKIMRDKIKKVSILEIQTFF